MTRRGVGFAVTLAVTLLLALATGIREIYMAVFSLGMLLVAALASALWAAARCRCAQSLSVYQAVRGDQVRLVVEVQGMSPVPVAVRLRVRTPGVPRLPGGREYLLPLPPSRQGRRLGIDLYCPHRGVWAVEVENLRIRDLFGFFSLPLLRRDGLSPMPEALTVYPFLVELDGEPPALAPSMDYTETNLTTADQGDSFAGTRQYRDGDSLKRIHWKQSIRTRELYTRQYEISMEQYTLVALDPGVSPGRNPEDYADMATECAAALCYFFCSRGQGVRLMVLGGEDGDTVARSPEEFPPLYTQLAGIPVGGPPLADAGSLIQENLGAVRAVYMITCCTNAALIQDLQTFIARRCSAVCIVPRTPEVSALSSIAQETGVRLVPVARPEDIPALLGDSL